MTTLNEYTRDVLTTIEHYRVLCERQAEGYMDTAADSPEKKAHVALTTYVQQFTQDEWGLLENGRCYLAGSAEVIKGYIANNLINLHPYFPNV